MNHLVIGTTDKTDYLVARMAEDFADGMLLVDPAGDLAHELADRIPVAHTERTVYFDPADIGHPPGFNVLEHVREDDRHRVALEIRDAIFPEPSTTLTRLRSSLLLLFSLRVLLDTPGTTLLDITRVLKDSDYRTACLRGCRDPMVRAFWLEDFQDWDGKDQQSGILDLTIRLAEITGSPMVRNVIGQPHTTFMFEGRTVIAKLPRAQLGDRGAYLLGVGLAARTPGAIYVNDAGFLQPHIPALLSTDRAALVLRFLADLSKEAEAAVLAIPEKTVFRTSLAVAERVIADIDAAAKPDLLVMLGPEEYRSSLTDPAPISLPTGRFRAVQRRSRSRNTVPRARVEKMLRGTLRA